MKRFAKDIRGYTIPELLMVIIVIGILTIIGLVAYNGIQQSSREAKIAADLDKITKAITVARQTKKTTLYGITDNNATAWFCMQKPEGTDLAAVPKTDDCWANYNAALDKISNAAGMNIRGIVDPWGRPYFIDENEDADLTGSCAKDVVGAYTQPFTHNWSPDFARVINPYFPGC